jgi:hypothetical protein
VASLDESDMLKINVPSFILVLQDIASLRQTLNGRLLPSDLSLRGSSVHSSALTPKQIGAMFGVLDRVEQSCKSLVLPATLRKVLYLRTRYPNADLIYPTENVLKDLEHLEIDFVQELCDITLLRVNSERVPYFLGDSDDTFPFGTEVAMAFPSANYEIREASNCFALERWPACIFHLMRTLEIALAALADKFTVPHDKGNWHNIIDGIESKLRGIGPSSGPNWKEQQKTFSDVATQFMFFKEAWRNHVMHVRDVYDEGRAKSIWQHVHEFMNKLTTIGLRELT